MNDEYADEKGRRGGDAHRRLSDGVYLAEADRDTGLGT
jgi:hypothetical protein